AAVGGDAVGAEDGADGQGVRVGVGERARDEGGDGVDVVGRRGQGEGADTLQPQAGRGDDRDGGVGRARGGQGDDAAGGGDALVQPAADRQQAGGGQADQAAVAVDARRAEDGADGQGVGVGVLEDAGDVGGDGADVVAGLRQGEGPDALQTQARRG